jgi:transcriptional regulator with XRE-family HTH domain
VKKAKSNTLRISAAAVVARPRKSRAERPPVSPEIDHYDAFHFGSRLREFRRQQSMSLERAAELVGVPASTLSRIENRKMSPTLDLILKIVRAMKLHPYDVLGRDVSVPQAGVVSVTRKGQAEFTELPNIFYAPLHPDTEPGGMKAILVTLFARSVKEYGGLTAHAGEEFLYVLTGILELNFEGRPPVTLAAGDSIMFDSHIPHAYVAVGEAQAKLLIVAATSDEPFRHLQT